MLLTTLTAAAISQAMTPWAFGEYLSNLAERPVLIEWFGEDRVVRAAVDPELPLDERIQKIVTQAGYDFELTEEWLALTPKRVRPDLRVFDNLLVWSQQFKPPVGEWAAVASDETTFKLAQGESACLADFAHAFKIKLGLVAPCFTGSRFLLFGSFSKLGDAISGLEWLLGAVITRSELGYSVTPDGKRILEKRRMQAEWIAHNSPRADRMTNSADLELQVLDRVGPENLEKLFMNWELEILLDSEPGTLAASLLMERYRLLREQLARQGQSPPELADPPRFQVLFSGKGHVSAQAEGKNGLRVVF